MFRYLLFIVLLLSGSLYSQKCPAGSTPVNFPPYDQVQINACIEDQVSLGKQSVFWGARNLTNDKLHIEFVKVVHTKCGNVLKESADTYLNPGEFVGGTTFNGEMTFETQVWKEDCNMAKYRVDKVSYENLTVQNISREERDKQALKKKEEDKREQQRIADSKKEQERQDAVVRQKAQQQTTYSQPPQINQNYARLQQTQDYINKSNAKLAADTETVKQVGEALGGIANAIFSASEEKEERLERNRERQRQANEKQREEERLAREEQYEEERRMKLEKKQAQREFEELTAKNLESYNYYMAQGDNLYDSGNYEQALANYLAASKYWNEGRCDFRLGEMYFNGEGTIANYDEALKWFQQATLQDNSEAQNYIGIIYEEKEDLENALNFYKQAAEKGNEWSVKNLARLYNNYTLLPEQHRNDLDSQQKWAEQYVLLAEKSDEADFLSDLVVTYKSLAFLYLGENKLKNIEKGKFYFEKLAVDDLETAYYLGRFYINGYIWENDLKKGISWISRASDEKTWVLDKGYPQAALYLGNLYTSGYKEITNDKIKADEYYKRYLQNAVKQNMTSEVAEMYKEGIGAVKNYPEAIKWQKKYMGELRANADSFTIATEGYLTNKEYDFIGDIYNRGGYGIKKNPAEAAKWYKKGFDKMVKEREEMDGYIGEEIMVAVDSTLTEIKPLRFDYYYPNLENDQELTYLHIPDNVNYNLIGYRYEKGIGVEVNAFKAIEWYEKEREGWTTILCDIGLMRVYSKAKNNEKVEEWYKKLQEDIQLFIKEARSEGPNGVEAINAGSFYYETASEMEKQHNIIDYLAKTKFLYEKADEAGYAEAKAVLLRLEKESVKK